MKCLLITGASGMLGYFVVREALLRGIPIAVIARGKKHCAARMRIEHMVSHLEETSNRILARPFVFEGDTSQADFGLNRHDLNWIRSHCDSFLHSAASVKFNSDPANNQEPVEPYLSNVEGTKNALLFAEQIAAKHFFHVSTAYVCGTRAGTIQESDQLGTGRNEFGNDYEASKAAAERLVVAATHLKSKTILRPSIIVGDIESGYSPSYHGIYTALQLGYLFLSGAIQQGLTELTPELVRSVIEEYFLNQLGLNGAEQKNLVPGNWVASTIIDVVEHEHLHNRVYHLTNPQPVSVEALCESMKQAVLEFLPAIQKTNAGIPDQLMQLDGFRSHMETYKAYFRNDPQFAQPNVSIADELQPCPQLSNDALVKLWSAAIRNEFTPLANGAQLAAHAAQNNTAQNNTAQTGNRHEGNKQSSTFLDALHCLAAEPPEYRDHGNRPPSSTIANKQSAIGIKVHGRQGGAWSLFIASEASDSKASPQADATLERYRFDVEHAALIQLNSQWLTRILNKESSIEQALFNGGLFIESATNDLSPARPGLLQATAEKAFDSIRSLVENEALMNFATEQTNVAKSNYSATNNGKQADSLLQSNSSTSADASESTSSNSTVG